MPIRTPAHKQTDPEKAPGVVQPGTLGAYLQAKYPDEIKPKKTFDEWMDQEYITINGTTWSRRRWWGEKSEAIDAARLAWDEARK